MGTYAFTETKVYSRYKCKNFYVFKWDNLKEGSTPAQVTNLPSNVELRVKYAGTWGTGGHLKIQGSMIAAPAGDSDWFDLNDSAGSPIDKTSDGSCLVGSGQCFRHFRAKVTAGTGVEIDVDVLAIP